MAKIEVQSIWYYEISPGGSVTHDIFKRLKFALSNLDKASVNPSNIHLNTDDVSPFNQSQWSQFDN